MSEISSIPTDHQKLAMLTVKQAAERLSIGRTTMFALIKSGDVQSILIGRLRRVPIAALEAYATELANQQRAA